MGKSLLQGKTGYNLALHPVICYCSPRRVNVSVIIIAAMARNRVIGVQGRLPWHIPEDLQRFREITTGHTVVMGRKTFESIGRALPDRRNIIISGNSGFRADGCLCAGSLEEALRLAGNSRIFICGGETVYRQAIQFAAEILLTVIDVELQGDSYFPEIPPEFVEHSRELLSIEPQAELITYRRTGAGQQ